MNNAKHHRSMLSRWFLSAVIVTIFCPPVYAQSVIEYFWNEDPGIGHGTIVKQTGNDSSGSDFTIDASNLRSGLNLLGMRANQHGKWSHTIYRLVSGADTSSDDWDVEYFWNDDPGVGKGIPVSSSGTDDNGKEFVLQTSHLKPGLNLLGLRANCHGQTSYTIYRMVAVGMDKSDQWKAEYFWNTDPGIGQATPIQLSAHDGDDYMSFSIDTSHLLPGLNLLGIRANSNNILSSTRTYIINISPSGDDTCEVEYFWDTDPGYGKGTPLSSGGLATGTLLELDLPTAGLTPGAHTLGIRSLSGQVGSTTHLSTVYVPGEKGPGCTYAEYFWGADPGYGKGTPIDITPGDKVTVDNLTIDFPEEPADEYVLSFRTRSENGWSPTVTKIIPHLSVEEITIAADTTIMARGASMQLTATVTPEDAFDNRVTWSSSDVSVISVDSDGKVTAAGAGKATVTATAADGSGTTGSIDLEVIVPVEAITIEPSQLQLSVSGTCRLTARLTPADATCTLLEWSCEGDAVTVDEEGNVTAVARGEATVTATSTDGSGVSGSCKVTVGYLMGDADDDGTLAVNDVVLTARGVVDDFDPKLIKEAVDMNSDGALTVGDLTLVVKSVIEWKPASSSAHAGRHMAPIYGNIALVPEADGLTVAVYTEGGIDFTGLQFDAAAPEGMAIAGITATPGIGQEVECHTFPDGTMRMLSYFTSDRMLPRGVPAARIHLVRTGDRASDSDVLEVTNAMASDFAGNLYTLGSAWAQIDTSGEPEVSADAISVTTEGHTVIVTVPDDRYIIFTDMRGISRRMSMTKGINRFDVPLSGVYAVDGIKIIIK